mmetsp:Transcript_178217/g.571260  ORF Transcript_178217/g.571260 Transcript_178217/m.571260 type:complete len:339 (-) Transcript_178217:878-1894(-)
MLGIAAAAAVGVHSGLSLQSHLFLNLGNLRLFGSRLLIGILGRISFARYLRICRSLDVAITAALAARLALVFVALIHRFWLILVRPALLSVSRLLGRWRGLLAGTPPVLGAAVRSPSAPSSPLGLRLLPLGLPAAVVAGVVAASSAPASPVVAPLLRAGPAVPAPAVVPPSAASAVVVAALVAAMSALAAVPIVGPFPLVALVATSIPSVRPFGIVPALILVSPTSLLRAAASILFSVIVRRSSRGVALGSASTRVELATLRRLRLLLFDTRGLCQLHFGGRAVLLLLLLLHLHAVLLGLLILFLLLLLLGLLVRGRRGTGAVGVAGARTGGGIRIGV